MSAHQLWNPEYGCYISIPFSNPKVPFTSITLVEAISDNLMAAYTTEEAKAYW